MTTASDTSVSMRGIRKVFSGGIVANDSVDLLVDAATIHAVIGENGAGKSTLMGVLYGRYRPDSGRVEIGGHAVEIRNPADAIRLGVGAVTQHTTMVPALSALENVILGAEPRRGPILDRRRAGEQVRAVADSLGMRLDWSARAESLSVAALQKAEIVKALFRGARILILDEPTASLAPAEADGLFEVLHRLAAGGTTVLLVTHKLREVMEHADAATVLRRGRSVGRKAIAATSVEELLGLMLGSSAMSSAAQTAHRPANAGEPVLLIEHLTVAGSRGSLAVRDVSLEVGAGEILGVAGVDGSGQRELAEAIVGLRPASHGAIRLAGQDVTRASVGRSRAAGLAYLSEDRRRDGLVLDFDVADNLLLGREREPAVAGGRFIRRSHIERAAATVIREYGIPAPGPATRARSLSGGNQQKLVLARALSQQPRALVALQPSRGLDVAATDALFARIDRDRARGTALLLFSLDLDELLARSDRIAVMHEGRIAGVLTRAEASVEAVGRLMLERRP